MRSTGAALLARRSRDAARTCPAAHRRVVPSSAALTKTRTAAFPHVRPQRWPRSWECWLTGPRGHPGQVLAGITFEDVARRTCLKACPRPMCHPGAPALQRSRGRGRQDRSVAAVQCVGMVGVPFVMSSLGSDVSLKVPGRACEHAEHTGAQGPAKSFQHGVLGGRMWSESPADRELSDILWRCYVEDEVWVTYPEPTRCVGRVLIAGGSSEVPWRFCSETKKSGRALD